MRRLAARSARPCRTSPGVLDELREVALFGVRSRGSAPLRELCSQLLEAVQGYAYDGYERTIDVHIKNLRQKIESDPGDPAHIKTVYGIGYKFEE